MWCESPEGACIFSVTKEGGWLGHLNSSPNSAQECLKLREIHSVRYLFGVLLEYKMKLHTDLHTRNCPQYSCTDNLCFYLSKFSFKQIIPFDLFTNWRHFHYPVLLLWACDRSAWQKSVFLLVHSTQTHEEWDWKEIAQPMFIAIEIFLCSCTALTEYSPNFIWLSKDNRKMLELTGRGIVTVGSWEHYEEEWIFEEKK